MITGRTDDRAAEPADIDAAPKRRSMREFCTAAPVQWWRGGDGSD